MDAAPRRLQTHVRARGRLPRQAVLPEEAAVAALQAVGALPSAGVVIGTAATAAMAFVARRMTRTEEHEGTRCPTKLHAVSYCKPCAVVAAFIPSCCNTAHAYA